MIPEAPRLRQVGGRDLRRPERCPLRVAIRSRVGFGSGSGTALQASTPEPAVCNIAGHCQVAGWNSNSAGGESTRCHVALRPHQRVTGLHVIPGVQLAGPRAVVMWKNSRPPGRSRRGGRFGTQRLGSPPTSSRPPLRGRPGQSSCREARYPPRRPLIPAEADTEPVLGTGARGGFSSWAAFRSNPVAGPAQGQQATGSGPQPSSPHPFGHVTRTPEMGPGTSKMPQVISSADQPGGMLIGILGMHPGPEFLWKRRHIRAQPGYPPWGPHRSAIPRIDQA